MTLKVAKIQLAASTLAASGVLIIVAPAGVNGQATSLATPATLADRS
jgi:hypothetical protein